MHKTASIKPTKVTKEDIELADEISLVTAIKEAVEIFNYLLEHQFEKLESTSETGNPVLTYKQITNSRTFLREAITQLQSNLLIGLGDIEPEDAKELSDPAAIATAGTMDAALESTEPTVEIHSEEK